MKDTIFIPKLCKVGFNPRTDTYTKMLGYVIYNDGKVWRKQTSWENWIYNYITDEEYENKKREEYAKYISYYAEMNYNKNRNKANINPNELHTVYFSGKTVMLEPNLTPDEIMAKLPYDEYIVHIPRKSKDPKIKPFEFENVPLSGFVLNKKAGGTSSGWNSRQTYCRVYDPRGFEIEITVPNLLYILEHANSIKGKCLDGKFIYGWDGKDLVLIPESAPEYADMLEYSKLESTSIKKSEMIVGGIYMDKYKGLYTYMGDFYEAVCYDWNDYYTKTGNKNRVALKKKLWFADDRKMFRTMDIKSLKKYTGEVNDNFANLMDLLEKHNYFSKEKTQFEKSNITESQIKDVLLDHRSWYGFMKDKGEIKPIKIVDHRYGLYNDSYFKVYIGRIELGLRSIKEFLNQYEIWQPKMTK